jgi:hypothetical protein
MACLRTTLLKTIQLLRAEGFRKRVRRPRRSPSSSPAVFRNSSRSGRRCVRALRSSRYESVLRSFVSADPRRRRPGRKLLAAAAEDSERLVRKAGVAAIRVAMVAETVAVVAAVTGAAAVVETEAVETAATTAAADANK